MRFIYLLVGVSLLKVLCKLLSISAKACVQNEAGNVYSLPGNRISKPCDDTIQICRKLHTKMLISRLMGSNLVWYFEIAL